VALYDYVARNTDELSFNRGTIIYLAPVGKYLKNILWTVSKVSIYSHLLIISVDAIPAFVILKILFFLTV
jgi:hypothetical protein